MTSSDTAIYYDKGPLLHPHVGKVLCAVVLGLERESSTALRLCARMRPKVSYLSISIPFLYLFIYL